MGRAKKKQVVISYASAQVMKTTSETLPPVVKDVVKFCQC